MENAGTKPGRTWRHHYVPQFYLRQWATDGRLWECRRAPRDDAVIQRRVATKQTGYASRLYSLEDEPLDSADPDELEQRLSQEEAAAARALQRMLSRKSWPPSDKDRRVWSRFIYLQLDRDPDRLGEALTLSEQVREEVLAPYRLSAAAKQAVELFTIETARNLARGKLVAPDEGRTSWEDELVKRTWTAVGSPGRFITSDRPILLDDEGVEPGKHSSVVSMALSPNRLLICTPASWLPDLHDDWFRASATTFNVRLASLGPRSVYSAKPLAELFGPGWKAPVERFLVRT